MSDSEESGLCILLEVFIAGNVLDGIGIHRLHEIMANVIVYLELLSGIFNYDCRVFKQFTIVPAGVVRKRSHGCINQNLFEDQRCCGVWQFQPDRMDCHCLAEADFHPGLVLNF